MRLSYFGTPSMMSFKSLQNLYFISSRFVIVGGYLLITGVTVSSAREPKSHEAIVDSLGNFVKCTDQICFDGRSHSWLTMFFTVAIDREKARLRSADFYLLTLSHYAGIWMLYLPSSLATRAVRLRSVNFGAVHERMHIPCADRSRCELCFHLDVSTA